MAEYVKEFHPKLIGLTGSEDQVNRNSNIFSIILGLYFMAYFCLNVECFSTKMAW